ncbi:hypothetical protein KDW19_14755 [Burkholderia cenocepacia]|nr:hypothetical protein [Burkholderia cenocepacia]MBR8483714.1 hypothetical protein [Burkholderia cenocepacia]
MVNGSSGGLRTDRGRSMSIASPISEAQRCVRLTVDVPIRRDVAYGGKLTLACQAKQGSAWKKEKQAPNGVTRRSEVATDR